MFSPTFFSLLETELIWATHDTNQEHRLRFDLRNISKANLVKELDKGDVAAGTTDRTTQWVDDQVLDVTWQAQNLISTLNTEAKMSITGLQSGLIQAKLAEIKAKATQRLTDGVAKIEAAHTGGLAKVDAATDGVIQKINKEVDDTLQEFAEFTNGGPV
jgi:hypothetical protein